MKQQIVQAELITIGDEILIGQVINTNSTWIAQKLNNIGINVKQITSVADSKEDIISALNAAKTRSDIILLTGGLGPTKDDITKQTLCNYFNVELVLNQNVLENVKKFFKSKGMPLTDLNKQQAELPSNCTALHNKYGTAPGMWFELTDKVFISLPGVPYEMQTMMDNEVIPLLQKRFSTTAIIHKTIMTTGLGESLLSEIIKDFENNLPKHIKLAYLPKPGIVRLRLSAYGNNKINLQKQIGGLILQLSNLIPQYIYGYDEESLEQVIGCLLAENNKTVSTAESCTGGYIAHLITSVPGSSRYYKGSVIAYANEIKENILGVEKQTIKKYGTVSEQTVIEMGKSSLKKFDTDYSIACSGIAGPDGGTEQKPVGTVWIAVSSKQDISTQKLLLNDNRERNIQRSAIASLNILRKLILNNCSKK